MIHSNQITILYLGLMLFSACTTPTSTKLNESPTDTTELLEDSITKIESPIQASLPEEPEITNDSLGRPSKPILEDVKIDTNLLFGAWASEHSYPNASFLINEEHYYIADFDGDGSIPYILKGDSLTIFFEWEKNTVHLSLPSPNLLIMTSNSGEYLYERFDNKSETLTERHPSAAYLTKKINNHLNSYQKITLDNKEFLDQLPDGGGELIGYFADDEVHKIILTIGLSYGMTRMEFYFKDYNRLFYCTEMFKQFKYNDETGSMDYSETEITFNGQYLFEPEFDYQTTGHNRFENDELDSEEVLRKEAADYLKIIKGKIGQNNIN